MSKIFRLYKGGAATYRDWNDSLAFPYDSTSRDTIQDPDGSSARHEITSIPSPFARIDLVKNAFNEVCNSDDIDGYSIFHKMVSDTLDVAEIFFNIDRLGDKIEVVKWDPSQMLPVLEQSTIDGHRYLADALQKYLVSDAQAYNFDKLNDIYLLNYVAGPDEINIIGATSPATLFFSNANDLSYVNDIYFAEDKPFDGQYQPLYKRDPEFIKYFFALRKGIPNFAYLFPEVDKYLNVTFRKISNQGLKNLLNSLSGVALGDFDPIVVRNEQQVDSVEILGYQLYKKRVQSFSNTSDFVIASSNKVEELPLVLPVEAGSRYSQLRYTTAEWGKTNHAPFMDNESDLSKRKLPFDGTTNPYLTIEDFLEDNVVKTEYTLNKSNYFDGNVLYDKPGLSFLLPLKPLFFKYFTVKDLCSKMPDGSDMFKMRLLAGNSLSVELKIPIKGNGKVSYIEYSRIYYVDRGANANMNEGGIKKFNFTGFIMPLIRFTESTKALYNVSCVQDTDANLEFLFYSENKRLGIPESTCRAKASSGNAILHKAENYVLKGQNFDYIQVDAGGVKSLIVPLFMVQKSSEVFEFAIDLGTSNTHIEYRKGKQPPEPFDFTQIDNVLSPMFVPQKNNRGYLEDLIAETKIIEQDYIPRQIGNGDFKFPTRTVLSCAKSIDWNSVVDPFSLINLPFTYDKRLDFRYNDIKSNIKWGLGDEMKVMEAYVRTLMLIIRNKVIVSGGKLEDTKIVWFYPISMPQKRLNRLRQVWNDAFNEYFGNGQTGCITESAAPTKYFFARHATASTLVNIDIGGGTTDIAFAKDRSVQYVTSFRFAANSLFEDAFSTLNMQNGIVDYHKYAFLELLIQKNLFELIKVFKDKSNAQPANMASFLFGLKENSDVKSAGIQPSSIDFGRILQDDEDFKIVFITFYTALIFHIAQIIKALGLDVPRHISFSGNGSKIISVITTDARSLVRYTKLVFEKVLGKPYGKDLEIIGLGGGINPKEATCKGGLIAPVGDNTMERAIVLKSDASGIVTSGDTYAGITDSYRNSTAEAVSDFFRFLFKDMDEAFDLDNNFGVSRKSFKVAEEVAYKDLRTFLDKGIASRREESEDEDMIDETFFFYPIKGVLQAMSDAIYKSLTNT